MNARTPPIFDGHNDILSKLTASGMADLPARFDSQEGSAIDVRRAAAGGFAGGLFAVWVPSIDAQPVDYAAMAEARFNVPLPSEVPRDAAVAATTDQIAALFALERAGLLKVCRSVSAIEAALAGETMAAVLHIEGAEAIDPELALLDVYHALGLRSLGPVWSRPNRFGAGVPFRFPSTPDTGPGLSDLGKRLVERCNTLGIMLDVSHLTEAGFWDLAKMTTRPIVATHSNVHALCATSRNLTDRQLAAIRESDGIVGVNFATAFLRADGKMLPDVPLTRILDHVEALIEALGEDRVGFGSDYDGAVVPSEIEGVDGLPRLREAMVARGYGEALIEKLAYRNWLAALGRSWA